MQKKNVLIAQGDKINGQSLVVLKSEGKLEKLNELQLKRMEEVKKFWLNYFFSCRNSIDRNKAFTGIEWLYKLAGYEKPIVVFVDSPMACQYATHLLKSVFKGGMLAQVGAQVRAQVWAQVWAQVGAQVRAQVWAQVWDQVWAQVRDQVWAQVNSDTKTQKLSPESFCSYGSVADYGWISFFDFFTQIGVIDHKGFNEFKDLLLSGVYDMIQLNGFCIVSDLPKDIARNDRGRLHSLVGPSIEFKDGYKQYYINGVHVSPELYDSLLNKKYSISDFISERNEETRAACLFFMREKWGESYVVSFFADHLKEIDTYVDRKDERYLAGTSAGMNTGVYTLFKGDFDGIKIAYVRCYCPSTDRMFYLGVDPEQKNAKDAIASLYRIPACLKKYIKEIRRQGERFSTTLTDEGNRILKTISKADAEDLATIKGDEYFSKMTYEY